MERIELFLSCPFIFIPLHSNEILMQYFLHSRY